jgi:hypothetical protein
MELKEGELLTKSNYGAQRGELLTKSSLWSSRGRELLTKI